jgi:hypothetical protein
MSDMVTEDFNQRCHAGDTDLLCSMEAAIEHLPPVYRGFWSNGLLARPLFVADDDITVFAERVRSLFDLLVALPQRVYQGDLGLYCEAAGIDEARARQVRRFADRPPTLFGRADTYRVGRSFKLLEFNVCSAIGGMDSHVIPQALMRVPAFRAFAQEHRLGYTDTGRMLASTLREAAAPVVDGGTPRVAFVCPDGEMDGHRPYLLPYVEMINRHGLDGVFGEIGSVTERGGRLSLNGERVDLVMRFLSDSELTAAAANGPAAETILRAHEEGRAVLWTGLENQRVNNKGALALLADDKVRAALTPEEAELVDLVLPWTRRLARTRTRIDAETVDLIDHCRSRREHLILKPSFGHGGKGHVAGWQTDDATWAASLEEGVEGSWIVQERVVPAQEPVMDPSSGDVRQRAGVWGVFFTPAGYAGVHVRTTPADSPDPIIRRGASDARSTGAFHYPATDGAL